MKWLSVLAIALAPFAACKTQAQTTLEQAQDMAAGIKAQIAYNEAHQDDAKAQDAADVAYMAALPEAGADYGTYPKTYQQIVKTYLANTLKDPESARYSEFTKLTKDQVMWENKAIYGYSLCVNVNARNSYGGYTGKETYWFLIRNGEVVRSETAGVLVYIGHYSTCGDVQNGP